MVYGLVKLFKAKSSTEFLDQLMFWVRFWSTVNFIELENTTHLFVTEPNREHIMTS